MHASPEAIDIHHTSHAFRVHLNRLSADKRMLPEQRRTLLRYIADGRAELIRPGPRKAVRRFSESRALKVAHILTRFAAHVKAPLDHVTPEQMQEFILGIEQGTIAKWGVCGTHQPYKPETVHDFKRILRQFYDWLFGHQSARAQDLTGWFDMRVRRPELRTFGLDAAQRMAKAVGLPQGQALIMMLFDGGFRAGELFNVRLRDVEFHPDEAGQLTCIVRIRVSKTKPRTISLPIATEAVKFWVERHPHGGLIGADGVIRAADPHATIITWTYRYASKVLAEVGKSELNERMYAHRFRHSSATFHAKFLSAWSLCARYGWSMGSEAVQRYVDASGVLAHDTASIIRKSLYPGAGPTVGSHQGTPVVAVAPPASPSSTWPGQPAPGNPFTRYRG